MPEPILLAIGLVIAFVAVLGPLRGGHREEPLADDAADRELRHRAALEALRDVEADHRAGTLDGAAYERERAAAEEHAVATRRALDDPTRGTAVPASSDAPQSRPLAVAVAVFVAVGLVAAALVPATGVANGTVVDQALADAEAREADRQERIGELLDALADAPDDPDLISDLADAYMEGSTIDDLAVAATLLRGLIDLEPDRADAYERIITAYVRADDYVNARAAHDAYADIPTADSAELAFLDGLIAIRGEDDPERAVASFDRFLAEKPDDARVPMVRGLRQDAAAELEDRAGPAASP